jgi:hypothetical protein
MLSRLIRSAAPVSGKVDFDLDGKLIGGWFQEGTKFYEQGPGRYWLGTWQSHLTTSTLP